MTQYLWQHSDWPNFTWDTSALLGLLGECRLQQGKLLSRVAGLGLQLEQQAQAELLIEEALTTSSIEGELLDARSVRLSVARRLGLPSAGLPVDRKIDELVNLLLDATQNFNKPLTNERLWGWHAALFPTGYSGLHPITSGAWRRGEEPMRVVSGPIGREKIHYEAPPSGQLNHEIQQFLNWWNSSSGTVEGLLRAAVAHLYFVTIHPFDDGNGRIARAITDLAIAQDDKQQSRYYSLSAQIMAERDGYYSILEQTQKSGCDITNWLVWFLGCFGRALQRSDDILNGVFAKSQFWRQYDQHKLTERQKKAINRLLDTGPDGFEGGMTTQKYASMTHCSRATAFRELDQLYELGMLQRIGQGRSVRYEILPEKPGDRGA